MKNNFSAEKLNKNKKEGYEKTWERIKKTREKKIERIRERERGKNLPSPEGLERHQAPRAGKILFLSNQ